MRHALRITLALLFLAGLPLDPVSALAQGGPGGGPGGGRSGGPGGGGPGGPGGGFAGGPGGFGGRGPDFGGVPAPLPRATSGPPPVSEQDAALDAVRRQRALPLERIIGAMRRQTADRVINAELMQSGGDLLYKLTVLAPSGLVRELFFNAKSAEPVEEP